MKVAVVGAGRTGTAVAVLLVRAGHRVVAVSGRGPTRDRAASYLPDTPVMEPAETARSGELVLIGVPDDLIEPTVAELADADAFGSGRYVAHLSGSRGLDVLDAARSAGAHRLTIHPLQTFPDVAHAVDRIPGSAIAVSADDEEGYLVAERIADDLLGEPFRLQDDLRALYHAGAVFASNYLVAVSSVAEQLFARAGVPEPTRAMAALQHATLDNVRELGPRRALTGPVVRGDAGTIERNLAALRAHAPTAVAAYVAMARVTADLATSAGRLTDTQRTDVDEVLARWS
jgi:predicted short-subunit dehydrogenase-like oxidoreductase (DUF2520 family)